VLEEHAAATIARARIPDLTNASPSLVGAIVAHLRGHKRGILDPYRYNCKVLHPPRFGCLRRAPRFRRAWALVGNVILSETLGAFALEDAEAVEGTL